MVKRVILLLLVFIFIFTSCNLIEYFDSESYTVRIVKSSELFGKFGDLSVSSYNKVLTIKIKNNLPERYFPESSTGEKMTGTRFYIAFFPDINICHSVNDNPYLVSGKKYAFKTGIHYLANDKYYKVEVPFYDLFYFPHGKHKIYFKIFQKNFFYEGDDEQKDTSLIWAIAETEIEIPEIYKTTLCTDSIVLRNDDSFSPAGMDFSFRLGYPDIYWKLVYYANKDDKDFPQVFRSGEATYSVLYPYSDTVSFLHYSQLNKINISVWDRDDMSADDFIGKWNGSVDELVTDKDKSYKELKFDNITKFKIKVLKKNVSVN